MIYYYLSFKKWTDLSFCNIGHNKSINWSWFYILCGPPFTILDFFGQVWSNIYKMFIKLVCNFSSIGIDPIISYDLWYGHLTLWFTFWTRISDPLIYVLNTYFSLPTKKLSVSSNAKNLRKFAAFRNLSIKGGIKKKLLSLRREATILLFFVFVFCFMDQLFILLLFQLHT